LVKFTKTGRERKNTTEGKTTPRGMEGKEKLERRSSKEGRAAGVCPRAEKKKRPRSGRGVKGDPERYKGNPGRNRKKKEKKPWPGT